MCPASLTPAVRTGRRRSENACKFRHLHATKRQADFWRCRMARTKVVRGTCTVIGCGRPHKLRGYCAAHAQRLRRGVPVDVPIAARDTAPPETCTADGCSAPVKAKGLCQAHYALLLRHGHTKHRDRKQPKRTCTINGCTNWYYASGLCHQHYMRKRKLREKYGITPAQEAEMFAAQSGVCAICACERTKTDSRSGKLMDFDVDHCHTTGKVRGLLCSRCNRGIGLFQDDPAILRRAAAYLESHST